MLRLHVLRHGESTWNALGRLQGRTHGVPLSRRGRAQAVHAATALRGVIDGPALVVSSDQVRARQTADVVGAALRCRVWRSPLLRERAYGDFEGRPAAAFECWAASTEHESSPVRGLESWAALRRRAAAALAEILSSVPQGSKEGDTIADVVVVSHGDTLRALLATVRGTGFLPPLLANGEHRTLESLPGAPPSAPTRAFT